jgi:hypothetical protein
MKKHPTVTTTELDRPITAIDLAWEKVNALGGTHGEYDDFGRGINNAVEQALFIIEELGGSDPAARRHAQTRSRIREAI